MGPVNALEAVDVQKLVDHVDSELVAGASGRDAEVEQLDVRVAPHEVGHGPVVRYLLEAVYDEDGVDGLDVGREAAVDAEERPVDRRGERQEVEEVREQLPDFRLLAVFRRALCVEAVVCRDLPGLVVSPDQGHPAWVLKLEHY